jgi:hypothetical protein
MNSSPSIKEFVLKLEEERNFGVMDLDDTHLLLLSVGNSSLYALIANGLGPATVIGRD